MATYNVSNLQFPDDLGVKPDLQHWVSFYINVRGKSRFSQNNRVGVVQDDGGAGLSSQQAATSARNQAVIGSIAAGANAVRSATNLDPIGTFGSGAIALGGAQIANSINEGKGVFKTDFTQQLSSVINLHMQEAPSVKYGANYNDVDLGVLSGLLSAVNSVQDAINMVRDTPADVAARIGVGLMQLPSAIAGGTGRFENLVGSAFKVKTNPFREVLFESVDYRTFNFRYRFMPKSRQESDNVRNIINMFKFHMHPELTDNKFFYIYPSEFEIVYNYRGSENQYFNRIQNCALTDLTVEYGGDKFATFENGAPVETILTLTFRELELLTKDKLADPEGTSVYGY